MTSHFLWASRTTPSVSYTHLLPALGFAMLGKILISPKVAPYFLLGFLLAAYLNVPVLGLSLIHISSSRQSSFLFFQSLMQSLPILP